MAPILTRLYSLIGGVLYTVAAIAQPQSVFTGADPCSGNLYVWSHLFLKYPDSTYDQFKYNYIKTNFPDELDELVKSIDNLNKLSISYLSTNKISFKLSSDEILTLYLKIDFYQMPKIDTLDIEALVIDEVLSEHVSEDYLGWPLIIGNRLEFKYIDRIEIANKNGITTVIRIPLIRKLLNPNIWTLNRGISPLAAYFNKITNKIYIYSFGEVYLEEQSEIEFSNVSSSYLAKIIIDLNSNNFGKATFSAIPGGFLETYGWLVCDEISDVWLY